MGKTSKPLHIIVTDKAMEVWPEVLKLGQQGHHVHYFEGERLDLIIGPNAWQMDEELRKYLPLAVKAARARKAGKGVKHEVDGIVEGETTNKGGNDGTEDTEEV